MIDENKFHHHHSVQKISASISIHVFWYDLSVHYKHLHVKNIFFKHEMNDKTFDMDASIWHQYDV